MSHLYRLALALALSLPAPLALAQSLADLKRDASTTGDVTTYGMGWGSSATRR